MRTAILAALAALCLLTSPSHAARHADCVWRVKCAGTYCWPVCEQRRSEIRCDDRGCRERRVVARVVKAKSTRHATHAKPKHRIVKQLVTQSSASLTPPRRFIFGRLICAINVNLALAERGITGTGSALAKSFLRWGHASGPQPGAVVVFNRGPDPSKGHVAIVSRVEHGRVWVWNPTRHGWKETVSRRAPIAYRVAG